MAKQSFIIILIILISTLPLPLPQNSNLNPKLSPQEATTYLGGSIKFICTKANISFETGWKTMLLPFSYIPASGNINVTLKSYVHNIEFNNTDVQCISRDPVTGKLYFSNVGKILIQGVLSSIKLKITKKDPCTIEVFWDPPFTLKGVPILGYNINITNNNTGEESSTFIQTTSIQVPLGYDYNISIGAVNGAGEGNKSIIFINSTDFNKNYNISQIEISREGNKWNVQAQISNDILCQNKSNQEIIFKVCKQDGSCYNTSNVSSHTASNRTALTAKMPLPEDHFYNLTIAFDYNNFTVVTEDVLLSTYDLQRIQDRKEPNGQTCLLLEYAQGSEATGCYIKLFCDSEKQFEFNITGFNNSYYRLWCISPFSDRPQICHLNGYDMVGKQIAGPAVQLEDVTILPITNSSTIITLKPSVTPTSKNSTPGGIIAGVIVGVFLACLIIACVLIFAVYYYRNKCPVAPAPGNNANEVENIDNEKQPRVEDIQESLDPPRHQTLKRSLSKVGPDSIKVEIKSTSEAWSETNEENTAVNTIQEETVV